MPHNYARCIAALNNALAWQRIARTTAERRHIATAETCLSVALEAFRAMTLADLTAAERAYLRALEGRAEADNLAEQSRGAIRSSLELLREITDPTA